MDINDLRERRSENAFSISDLNGYIKNMLDRDRVLSAITVVGEISNFKDHSGGHLYFSLKDSDAQIKAVMFKSQRLRLKFAPEDGMRVKVFGSVSYYSQGGSIQIYVNSMEPDGVGSLYLAYERLKEKLFREGLFDEEHKKPIPRIPRRIGVITSPTGAALRDIINVTGRRFPLAEMFVYPSLVQGENAEANLIKGIEYFENLFSVDVIIIGRGGGSIEDLWAFNGEKLARAIYSANTPIISAVGHETDFTVCDFVSDLRAPTPSAAAEVAVPDFREIYQKLSDVEYRLELLLKSSIEKKKDVLSGIRNKPIFTDTQALLSSYSSKISDLNKNACDAIGRGITQRSDKLAVLSAKADALSPLSVLKRGYSVCTKEDGSVADASRILAGDCVFLTFDNGVVNATVTSVKKKRSRKK